MSPAERHRRVMQIFDEACDLPPGDRTAFLARECGDDEALRIEVESLLAQDEQPNRHLVAIDGGRGIDLLAADMTGVPDVHQESESDDIPERIGAYRIKRLIGYGGMGAVYEAEQENPQRRVALKVVRPGLTGGQFSVRFRREAQVLGLLQHVGIGQIHEAGIAEFNGTSQPYFAMEYVDGMPIDLFARQRSLCTPSRLALIARVCDAVHYAHERGVIHRDLKPGNILVTTGERDTATDDSHTLGPISCRESPLCDASWRCAGQPKILDFGVARLTDADVQMTTLQTEVGQLVGTLTYMSPEQASGESATLDRRCDVYALGALLHELLAGAPPLNIRGYSVPEAMRRISDEEPTHLGTINTNFRGDIETIVCKALEKDVDRRYRSAEEMAADIRRHLNDEPIRARPISTIYQLRKFTRRNKALVGGIFATMLAIVVGAVFAGYFAINEFRQRQRAEEQKQLADRRYDEVIRLSDLKRLNDAIAKANTLWPELPVMVPAMKQWLTEYAKPLESNFELHNTTLEALRVQATPVRNEAGNVTAWTLPNAELQWRHDMLTDLVMRLQQFLHPESGIPIQVMQRINNAKSVGQHTVESADAQSAWNEAVNAIRESAVYGGLRVSPQAGLYPLGFDERSGFYEFLHLRSGQPPPRDSDTNLPLVKPGSGIVMVLLPGGTFTMGCQAADPDAPNHDPQEGINERPVHDVTLAPFLLSKFEVTQAQWRRMTGQLCSGYSRYSGGDVDANDAHPAEQINWTDAMEFLPHYGFTLPTEAQWEYAARAGTDTPWPTGTSAESIIGYANVADRSLEARRHGTYKTESWIDDGFFVHAPVGSFQPNQFGLHDMMGNVSEWCRDLNSLYLGAVSGPEALRDPSSNDRMIVRGGSWSDASRLARSAARHHLPPDTRSTSLGIRPVWASTLTASESYANSQD